MMKSVYLISSLTILAVIIFGCGGGVTSSLGSSGANTTGTVLPTSASTAGASTSGSSASTGTSMGSFSGGQTLASDGTLSSVLSGNTYDVYNHYTPASYQAVIKALVAQHVKSVRLNLNWIDYIYPNGSPNTLAMKNLLGVEKAFNSYGVAVVFSVQAAYDASYYPGYTPTATLGQFIFPWPSSDDQRSAFVHFLEVFEQTMGSPQLLEIVNEGNLQKTWTHADQSKVSAPLTPVLINNLALLINSVTMDKAAGRLKSQIIAGCPTFYQDMAPGNWPSVDFLNRLNAAPSFALAKVQFLSIHPYSNGATGTPEQVLPEIQQCAAIAKSAGAKLIATEWGWTAPNVNGYGTTLELQAAMDARCIMCSLIAGIQTDMIYEENDESDYCNGFGSGCQLPSPEEQHFGIFYADPDANGQLQPKPAGQAILAFMAKYYNYKFVGYSHPDGDPNHWKVNLADGVSKVACTWSSNPSDLIGSYQTLPSLFTYDRSVVAK